MKGTLIALDLVKDTDNSFKILEMNTSVKLMFDSFNSYTDLSSLHTYIANNNISEVHFIGMGQTGAPGDTIDSEFIDFSPSKTTNLSTYLKDHYSGSAVNVTEHRAEYSSVNIPYIEDSPTKLIIRNSYDSSAVIDSQYAAQNINFLNLLNDSGSSHLLPKMFMSGGIDTIGTGSVRDNGDYPNYIIKRGTPTVNYFDNPQLLKISGSDQLENVKHGYLANEGDDYLQEFIYNPNDLVNGTIKTYRIWGFVDSNLDLIPFNTEPFYHSNPTALTPQVDYFTDSNGIEVLQKWERPKFLQKIRKVGQGIAANCIGEQNIILNDNSIVKTNTVVSGSVLKSINLPGLSQENNKGASSYSGSLSDFASNTTFTSASINNKAVNEIGLTKAVAVKTSENKEVTFALSAPVLVENDANETRFKQSKYIEVGDKLVEFNYNTNTARTVTVATVGYRTSVTYAAELDVEQADVFTVAYDTSDENVGFAIHNKEPALCECQYCSEGAYDAGTCLSSPDCSTFYSACTQGGYPCFGYTYSMPDGCTNGEGKE